VQAGCWLSCILICECNQARDEWKKARGSISRKTKETTRDSFKNFFKNYNGHDSQQEI
jgi:hypothetical protein